MSHTSLYTSLYNSLRYPSTNGGSSSSSDEVSIMNQQFHLYFQFSYKYFGYITNHCCRAWTNSELSCFALLWCTCSRLFVTKVKPKECMLRGTCGSRENGDYDTWWECSRSAGEDLCHIIRFWNWLEKTGIIWRRLQSKFEYAGHMTRVHVGRDDWRETRRGKTTQNVARCHKEMEWRKKIWITQEKGWGEKQLEDHESQPSDRRRHKLLIDTWCMKYNRKRIARLLAILAQTNRSRTEIRHQIITHPPRGGSRLVQLVSGN